MRRTEGAADEAAGGAEGTLEGDIWELYNLKDDPGESNNQAATESTKLETMIAAWKQWKASVEASDKGGDY